MKMPGRCYKMLLYRTGGIIIIIVRADTSLHSGLAHTYFSPLVPVDKRFKPLKSLCPYKFSFFQMQSNIQQIQLCFKAELKSPKQLFRESSGNCM